LATRLAFDEPHVLRSGTIGESWFAVADRILARGVPSRYDGLPIRENAHSIDFGAKGYGNLVELASLQRHVADALGAPVGRLVMIVRSAHVYETELEYIKGVLAGGGQSRVDA